MAEYRKGFQQPDPRGHDRWSIQGGDYRWYLPDPLTGQPLHLTPATQSRLESVSEEVARLGERFRERPLPALYATLLRSESIASSRIEGVREDPSAVLLADIDDAPQREHSAAHMISRNIDAVRQAVETLATQSHWSSADIDALHRTLLPTHPVGFRDRLVWISGNSPVQAKYVAPHPEYVPALVEDLVTYLETTDDPPLVRAALSHAQLETIHPWTDGNGRAGRALIQAVLARSGIVSGGVHPSRSFSDTEPPAMSQPSTLFATTRAEAGRRTRPGRLSSRTSCRRRPTRSSWHPTSWLRSNESKRRGRRRRPLSGPTRLNIGCCRCWQIALS